MKKTIADPDAAPDTVRSPAALTATQAQCMTEVDDLLARVKALEKRTERARTLRRGTPEQQFIHYVGMTLSAARSTLYEATSKGALLEVKWYELETTGMRLPHLRALPLPAKVVDLAGYRARRVG
jgi:hypothetical protein